MQRLSNVVEFVIVVNRRRRRKMWK